VPAPFAPEARKPAGQRPAAQEPAELRLDESRQTVLVHTGRLDAERLEVVVHHLVQHALSWRLRPVA
jgi:hypothetical protein